MNLLTPLPSVLAKVSELVERNVTDSLEIVQGTEFPVLQFPQPLRAPPALSGTTILQTSTTFTLADNVTNPAPAVTTDLCVLGEGIWDLTLDLIYTSSFTGLGTSLTWLLGIRDPITGVIHIVLAIGPTSFMQIHTLKRRLTSDRQDMVLHTTLSANGAGESHSFRATVGLDKVL